MHSVKVIRRSAGYYGKVEKKWMCVRDGTYEPLEDPLHLLLDIFQTAVWIQDTVYDQVYTTIIKQHAQ